MTGTSTPVPVVCAAVDGSAEAWLTVPCRPDQVCVVREFVRRQLADDPRAETAVLLASELATNSVQHSSSRLGRVMTVILVAARDGIVLVGVADAGGATVPVLRDEGGGYAEGGRGLRLVSYLCPRWGFRIQPDGGLVTWFALGQGRGEQADGRGGVGATGTLRDAGRGRGVLGAPPRARPPERYREQVATATDSRPAQDPGPRAGHSRLPRSLQPAGPALYLACGYVDHGLPIQLPDGPAMYRWCDSPGSAQAGAAGTKRASWLSGPERQRRDLLADPAAKAPTLAAECGTTARSAGTELRCGGPGRGRAAGGAAPTAGRVCGTFRRRGTSGLPSGRASPERRGAGCPACRRSPKKPPRGGFAGVPVRRTGRRPGGAGALNPEAGHRAFVLLAGYWRDSGQGGGHQASRTATASTSIR
jgi:anti-sigma regulatory factor (Ser/Thr protein kinase)